MKPNSFRRPRLASACLCSAALLAGACGSEEAPREDTPRSEAQAPPALPELPVRRPPPDLPAPSANLGAGELKPLLAARPPAVPPEVARALEHLDPAASGWPCVARVDAAERTLREVLVRRVAGERPDVGGDLPDQALLPDFPGQGLEPRPPSDVEVQVEVVAYDEPDPDSLVVECNVTLARRPDAASRARRPNVAPAQRDASWREERRPFQLDYLLETRWEQAEGQLRLVHAQRRTAASLAPICEGALFEERTRQAFGADQGFEEELLRGPDAYYFHSDRLSGYDLICNHGMALGDLDGDGWEDLYVCMAPGLPNRMYLRGPDGGVRDVAANLGVAYLDATRSALILDLDGDGRRDLTCAVGGDVLVHWNEGAGLSAPTVLRPASDEDVFSMAAADYDGDGDLDLYACRYSAQGVMQGYPTPYHDARNGAPNVLWRNEGGRAFADVTSAVGLDAGNTRYSFAATWEDFDEDGDVDLYVANDFGPNHYWRNEGGSFRDVAAEVGAEDMAAGMGVAVGDVDGDGDLDLYVSNMYASEGLRSTSRAERFLAGRGPEVLPLYRRHARGNTLLVNRGDGTWEDRSEASGAARGGWAWGALFLDVENDGDLDIYSPNGFVTRRVPQTADEYFWRHVIASSPVDEALTPAYHDAWYSMQYLYFELGHGWNGEERNRLFLGDGHGAFLDASAISGADALDDARSLVVVDWDRDGFQDLVLKNRGAPRLRLLRNRGHDAGAKAWLVVDLAQPGSANLDAIGARVRVETDRGTLTRSVVAGDGFLVQSSCRLHFGLGHGAAVRALEVRWPDGERTRYEGPFESATALRIERGQARPQAFAWSPVEGFEGPEPESLQPLPGFSGRTVLFDKLPLAPLSLPAFAGGQRSVHSFNGRPLLVSLWSDDGGAGRAQLEHFARQIEALDRSGLVLVPLAVDGGAQLVEARRTCERLGLERDAGFVDGWTRQALEVLLLEVYHRTETNPIPTSLLIDRAGQLCVVYQGPVSAERVLADLAVMEQMDPRMGTCARLQRGRWASRPKRDLRTLRDVFSGLGYQDFAGYYSQYMAIGR